MRQAHQSGHCDRAGSEMGLSIAKLYLVKRPPEACLSLRNILLLTYLARDELENITLLPYDCFLNTDVSLSLFISVL